MDYDILFLTIYIGWKNQFWKANN